MEDHSHIGKKNAAIAALKYVEEGMTLGLGTGSTASYFIRALAGKKRAIRAVATSVASESLAKELGITLIDPNTVTSIDLVVDGADEVDPQKRLIKGAGGALLREKIIANMSHLMVVVIDHTKLVEHLGQVPLPVEVVPFCLLATREKLKQMGFEGTLRGGDKSPYITDNQNFILDLDVKGRNPEKTHSVILALPGVVETGYFIGLAGPIFVGYPDGSVDEKG